MRTTTELLNDIMSMEMFKLPALEIAPNFGKESLPCYVFQFSVDLPAVEAAIHTGNLPFSYLRNFTSRDTEK